MRTRVRSNLSCCLNFSNKYVIIHSRHYLHITSPLHLSDACVIYITLIVLKFSHSTLLCAILLSYKLEHQHLNVIFCIKIIKMSCKTCAIFVHKTVLLFLYTKHEPTWTINLLNLIYSFILYVSLYCFLKTSVGGV